MDCCCYVATFAKEFDLVIHLNDNEVCKNKCSEILSVTVPFDRRNLSMTVTAYDLDLTVTAFDLDLTVTAFNLVLTVAAYHLDLTVTAARL